MRSFRRSEVTALLLGFLLWMPGCGDDGAAGPQDDDDVTGGDDDTTGPMGDDDDTVCPEELAERVVVTAVDVSPSSVSTGSSGGFSENRPVILAPLADGRSKVAWTDGTGTVHVTPLDASDGRAGDDTTLPGDEVRGLVALDAGAMLLVRRDDTMALVQVDGHGDEVLERVLAGDNSHGHVGDQWIDSWSHEGRLASSGGGYAAYFGLTQLWDSGNHQGDALHYFDSAGSPAGGGWSWGCSHSLDVRMAYSGAQPGPVCLSDCYPGKGIYFDHYTEVFADPSGNCAGSSDTALGGLVAVDGGFLLTFTSPVGRASDDVALVHIGSSGAASAPTWLTDTPSVHEGGAHLAPYGDAFLVSWVGASGTEIGVIDSTGTFLEGPVAIEARIADRDDMVGHADGDVGWAFAWGSSSELKVVRVLYCE